MLKPRLLNLPEPIGKDQLLKDLSAGLIISFLGAAAEAIFKFGVEPIISRFGELSVRFPAPGLPSFDLGLVRVLVGLAGTIALLGGIESLHCALCRPRKAG